MFERNPVEIFSFLLVAVHWFEMMVRYYSVPKREKELSEIAIECLQKYRTVKIEGEHSSIPTGEKNRAVQCGLFSK